MGSAEARLSDWPAFHEGGVAAFATALDGPAWRPAEAPDDLDRVAHDLAMFARFEPGPVPDPDTVSVTVGELSPPVRHRSVQALHEALGVRVHAIAGTAHAVHLEQPAAFAALLRDAANAAG